MRYQVLATDYDGTLATDGRVQEPTLEALARLRATGRRLVLVTGRFLFELRQVFARADLFDVLVGENGATACRPGGADRSLAAPLPPALPDLLRTRGVPVAQGQVILATSAPYEAEVLRAARELGLGVHLEHNQGAVMVVPPGVTKATGLEAALAMLDLTLRDAVAIGDAENDRSMLAAAELGVAVANASPAVKRGCDLVTGAARGAGVSELVGRLLADDLADVVPSRRRQGHGGRGRPRRR